MRVSDVLAAKPSTKVCTIPSEATVDELLDLLAEHNIGALVVSDDDRTMIGIVSERDVVRKLRGITEAGSARVKSIMTTEVQSARPQDTYASLMATMTEHRVRHVPVVDDEGTLVGLVSIGDAVKHRMDQLKFERDQLNSYVAGG